MPSKTPRVTVISLDSVDPSLIQYFRKLRAVATTLSADCHLDKVIASQPTHLVLSPVSSGHMGDAPVFQETMARFSSDIPTLVCLGYQDVRPVHNPWSTMRDKFSLIHHAGEGLFAGLAKQFKARRDYSLAPCNSYVSKGLKVLAWTKEGEAIAVCSESRPLLFVVHFHPEFMEASEGKTIFRNFLNLT